MTGDNPLTSSAAPWGHKSLHALLRASERPRVLTFTSLFPNAEQPLHGLFVRERTRALARLCGVQVLAPVPWVPPVPWLGERYRRYSQVPPQESQEGLVVRHPRFVVIPKLLKAMDALLMALSVAQPFQTLHDALRFDIFDAHLAYPDGTAAAILARRFRIPLAITVRGDDINVFAREFWRSRVIRWGLRQADVVITVSRELAGRVRTLGVDASRIVVIPNGVDTERFCPRDNEVARHRLGISADRRILLSVGRLHMSKGHTILVEALARLRKEFPNLELVIVGDSDHEDDARPLILQTARRHGLLDRVHLVGPQPPAMLVEWYSVADLFCLPTEREGSANVLLEALACGLPCVTTPVGGNVDVISNPDLGVLAIREAGAFAEAIREGLSRGWNRERIAAHARGRSWSVVAHECFTTLSALVRSGIAVGT